MDERKPLLRPETMEKLRSGLDESDKYTDEELENAVFFLVVTPLQAAATIGAADGSVMTMAIVSDLIARAFLATYINHGAIDPRRIDAFMEKIDSGEVTSETELAKGAVSNSVRSN